jgi:hypothetical protein
MKNTIARFQIVEKNLLALPWFKKEGWQVTVRPFPEKNPDGITFQMFKKNWLNEDRQGIHFESYLDLDPKQQKKSYITLHILHQAEIPGTKIKRAAITKPFVDSIMDEVKTWEGYSFRAGKYGHQPFARILDGTSKNFERELEQDLIRLCRKLGPSLDKSIAMALNYSGKNK